jgi:hypothetical protein
LNWDGIVGAVLGYNVYRDGSLITSTPITTQNFTDTNVSNGTHIYGITIVYEIGESAPITNVVDFVNPVPLITPDTRDFSVIVINQSSDQYQKTISNIGGSNITISGIELAGEGSTCFTLIDNNILPITLSTEESITVSVAFAPIVAGNKSVSLNFITNIDVQPHTVSLSGIGFELVPPQNLTSQINSDEVVLSWQAPSIEILGSALLGYRVYRNDELISNALVSGTQFIDIAPFDGEYVYSVTAMYIYGESDTVSRTVYMTNPVFSISPSTKDFGAVHINEISDEQAFLVSNTGGNAFTISSIHITGDTE